ncbi:MAG: hypothetical protein AB7P05_06985 [Hyphomonadaceae bacterium]
MTQRPIPLPSIAAQKLIVFCRESNRVCPLPMPWNELWEMLPDRRRVGLGWEPAVPLILAAWADTPALAKAERLSEHIIWADTHGALASADSFLRGLDESQWLHFGEWPA